MIFSVLNIVFSATPDNESYLHIGVNSTLILCMLSFFLFLSIFTGSLIHEHYTRECEFGNIDKIKNKNNTKKQNNTKKHKNFWQWLEVRIRTPSLGG